MDFRAPRDWTVAGVGKACISSVRVGAFIALASGRGKVRTWDLKGQRARGLRIFQELGQSGGMVPPRYLLVRLGHWRCAVWWPLDFITFSFLPVETVQASASLPRRAQRLSIAPGPRKIRGAQNDPNGSPKRNARDTGDLCNLVHD